MSFSKDLFLEYKRRPDKSALERLLECHQDAVYTLCYQVLRHPQDAEGACQEVLLEICRELHSIEDPNRFSGWLYRASLHTALDMKRRRQRRRVRDAHAPPAPSLPPFPDEGEELHQMLASLDDTSRQLVMDHYFAERPLRELAAERGCSEVAVWKKIEHARERLRKVLGSAGMTALEKIVPLRAPAHLLRTTLGLKGGLTMAASTAIKLAIVAPLVLLGGVGVVWTTRRPPLAPAELSGGPGTSSLAPRTPSPNSPATFTPSPAASSLLASSAAKASLPMRPYPFRRPAVAISQPAARTRNILSRRRLSIEESNVPIAEFIRRLAREAEIPVVFDPEIPESELLSIKVTELSLDQCFRLTLQARGLGFEILVDGTLRIAPLDRLGQDEGPDTQKAQEALRQLEDVRRMLDGRWDGLQDPDDFSESQSKTLAKSIVVPQGESSLREEFRRLWETSEVFVRAEVSEKAPSLLDRPFLQLVEERTVGQHLEELARRSGLVLVPMSGDMFILTDGTAAEGYRQKEEERKHNYENGLKVFANPLPLSGTVFVQDLLDSLPRFFGVTVIPSQDVWESGAAITLGAKPTLREALDLVKAQGFRWAIRERKLFIVK